MQTFLPETSACNSLLAQDIVTTASVIAPIDLMANQPSGLGVAYHRTYMKSIRIPLLRGSDISSICLLAFPKALGLLFLQIYGIAFGVQCTSNPHHETVTKLQENIIMSCTPLLTLLIRQPPTVFCFFSGTGFNLVVSFSRVNRANQKSQLSQSCHDSQCQ